MLENITPLILTFNEAPNITRTLDRLHWASDIVVVDSESSDGTPDLIAKYPNVRMFRRPFDSHAQQWNYGLTKTAIDTTWVLALDADYLLTDQFVEEMRNLLPDQGIAGYRASFRYCVYGKILHGSAYPPVTVLFRRAGACYVQDGHTQRVSFEGGEGRLVHAIIHDDRKPLRHWIASQERYMRLEVVKLRSASWKALGWADRLRRLRVVAPIAMLFYCLFARGAVVDGRAGIYYALQRTFAELLLSLYLLEGDLRALG